MRARLLLAVLCLLPWVGVARADVAITAPLSAGYYVAPWGARTRAPSPHSSRRSANDQTAMQARNKVREHFSRSAEHYE